MYIVAYYALNFALSRQEEQLPSPARLSFVHAGGITAGTCLDRLMV